MHATEANGGVSSIAGYKEDIIVNERELMEGYMGQSKDGPDV